MIKTCVSADGLATICYQCSYCQHKLVYEGKPSLLRIFPYFGIEECEIMRLLLSINK